MKNREAPKINLAPVPNGYGRILVHGFDWWQECLNIEIPGGLWQRLKDGKARAVELDDRRKTPIAFDLGEVTFQLMPTGAKGGKEFVLVSDDFRIEIGSPKREWSFSWRATSAAIWSKGIEALRSELYAILQWEGCTPRDPDDFKRLTRVDYCFDVHSRAFTGEMYPRIASQTVCPKETKVMGDFVVEDAAPAATIKGNMVVQKKALETLTIGLGAKCQVQIYDKAKEITEASNKTWLFDHWGFDPETGEIEQPDAWQDVWRVEIRLRTDWLKDRKVNTPEKFLKALWVCLADALYNRRLCQPTRDTNRRRWPLHPIYALVLTEIGNPREFKPIDRRALGRADVLEKQMLQNLAGTCRSLVMLRLREEGAFDESEAEEVLEHALKLLLGDREHQEKIRRAIEKYALVDAPL